MDLIDSLIKDEVLRTPVLIDAFRKIDRGDFVPAHMRETARHANHALPIGYEQTISQPWTVAFMLELLQPKPGQKILDIGAGSGWTTALLAHVVNEQGMSKSKAQISNETQSSNDQKGRVFAMERVEELCRFGEENVGKYSFIERGIVEFRCGDAKNGWEDEAPFDRIIAAATLSGDGFDAVPQAWLKQCAVDGTIVTPIDTSIWKFTKQQGGKWTSEEHPGFVFVPFIAE